MDGVKDMYKVIIGGYVFRVVKPNFQTYHGFNTCTEVYDGNTLVAKFEGEPEKWTCINEDYIPKESK